LEKPLLRNELALIFLGPLGPRGFVGDVNGDEKKCGNDFILDAKSLQHRACLS
jgi:hypothetical protein